MSAHYSQLPSYSDDTKTPLLSEQPVYITVGPIEEAGELRVGGGNGDGCAGAKRSCFFGRMRARCAARCAAKYGPPCDNARCQKKDRRRRKFRFLIFGFIALFAFVHLIKGAYFMYTLPKHINCQSIEDSSISVDLPLSKKLIVAYSLTTSTTSIIHDADAPSDQITVKVKFDNVEEGDESLLCSGNFKRAGFVGAYTKQKDGSLPKIASTTIVLPADAVAPRIVFGSEKASRRAERIARKLLKWHRKCHKEEEKKVQE